MAIENILRRAGMYDCSEAVTPVSTSIVFTKADCPKTKEEVYQAAVETKWYRSILASCLYISTWTRPDLSFSLSKLCKYMQNPGPVHITALKRLLRYLQKTISVGLNYSFKAPPPSSGVYGYYDASHADDVETRRSTLAYVFYLEGCIIS